MLLGEEVAGLCAYRAFFVNYAHVILCHFFLFLLVSGIGCGGCLWLFLDFSVYVFAFLKYLVEFFCINSS